MSSPKVCPDQPFRALSASGNCHRRLVEVPRRSTSGVTVHGQLYLCEFAISAALACHGRSCGQSTELQPGDCIALLAEEGTPLFELLGDGSALVTPRPVSVSAGAAAHGRTPEAGGANASGRSWAAGS